VAGTRVQVASVDGVVAGTRAQGCTNSQASRSHLTIPDASTVPHRFPGQGTPVSLATVQKAAVRTTTGPVICAPVYILYTGCNRRNVPNFGRVFLMLNYTEKARNTYIQS
jgi:hypothetical protein